MEVTLREIRVTFGAEEKASAFGEYLKAIGLPAKQVLGDLGPVPAGAEIRTDSARVFQANSSSLTPRELEILRLVAAGHTNRAIAATLFISPATVKRHVTNILAKLDLPTRAAAISFALRNRLIDDASPQQ